MGVDTAHRGWVADVLVVTTSVRVLHGVHRTAAHLCNNEQSHIHTSNRNGQFSSVLERMLVKGVKEYSSMFTFGHSLRLTRYLWKARPAFSMGLSVRPPPAMMPTMARQRLLQVRFEPEGMRMRVVPWNE